MLNIILKRKRAEKKIRRKTVHTDYAPDNRILEIKLENYPAKSALNLYSWLQVASLNVFSEFGNPRANLIARKQQQKKRFTPTLAPDRLHRAKCFYT